jgi:hypothetical protein
MHKVVQKEHVLSASEFLAKPGILRTYQERTGAGSCKLTVVRVPPFLRKSSKRKVVWYSSIRIFSWPSLQRPREANRKLPYIVHPRTSTSSSNDSHSILVISPAKFMMARSRRIVSLGAMKDLHRNHGGWSSGGGMREGEDSGIGFSCAFGILAGGWEGILFQVQLYTQGRRVGIISYFPPVGVLFLVNETVAVVESGWVHGGVDIVGGKSLGRSL